MTARVVINEQHKLLPQQEEILKKEFGGFERVDIPAEGLTAAQQNELAEELVYQSAPVVFVSPAPVLLALVVGKVSHGRGDAYQHDPYTPLGNRWSKLPAVYLFHNDYREKKELPDGRIVMTVAREGWKLIRVDID